MIRYMCIKNHDRCESGVPLIQILFNNGLVLNRFIRFYQSGFFKLFIRFYQALSIRFFFKGFIRFYQVLSGYKVLSGFIRFYQVLSGFISFYRVVSGFIRFYQVLSDHYCNLLQTYLDTVRFG